MILSFKRLARWPQPSPYKRRFLGGTVKFDVTRNELVARLLELGATQATVGLDFDAGGMSEEGWPRANAIPKSPGVLLVVECPVGPLFLACDTYVHWLQNLYALVLVLENLRKVAAHDVVPAHELYLPFRREDLAEWLVGNPFSQDLSNLRITALGKGKWSATTRLENEWGGSRPTEPPPPRSKARPHAAGPKPPPPPRAATSEAFSTRAKAAAWLADKTGALASAVLSDERAFVEAYRLAARTMHPDVGGEAAQFRRLQHAKAAIERGAPWMR